MIVDIAQFRQLQTILGPVRQLQGAAQSANMRFLAEVFSG